MSAYREAAKCRALDRLGTHTKPICATCGEARWECMRDAITCFNCHRKRRRPKTNAGEGCALCGEHDARCLDIHHVWQRRGEGPTILLCVNCHRIRSMDVHEAENMVADGYSIVQVEYVQGVPSVVFVNDRR